MGPYFGPSMWLQNREKKLSLIMGPYFGPSIGTISTNTVCVENRLNIGRSKHLYCDETTGRYTTTYEIYMCACLCLYICSVLSLRIPTLCECVCYLVSTVQQRSITLKSQYSTTWILRLVHDYSTCTLPLFHSPSRFYAQRPCFLVYITHGPSKGPILVPT